MDSAPHRAQTESCGGNQGTGRRSRAPKHAVPTPSFQRSRVSPPGQGFTGILHRAWSRFPMGLVTVNEQTLASCLSSPPLLHGQAPAGLRWLGGGGKSQYLEGKLKLPAQSKPLLRQRHPDSAPNTSPPPVLAAAFSWSQNKPLWSELVLKAPKKRRSINYSEATEPRQSCRALRRLPSEPQRPEIATEKAPSLRSRCQGAGGPRDGPAPVLRWGREGRKELERQRLWRLN